MPNDPKQIDDGGRCGSFHAHGGMICVRPRGHDGLCWSDAVRGRDGSITRGEWISKDGKFVSHHRYATTYPSNAKRGNNDAD